MADQPDWTLATQTFIESVPILNTTIAHAGATTYVIPVDLSQWPSIVLVFGQFWAICNIKYQWIDDAGTTIIDSGYLYMHQLPSTLEARLQVKSKTLRLVFSNMAAAPALGLQVFGSTVPVISDTVPGQEVQEFIAAPVWVASTPQAIGTLYSNGLPCWLSATIVVAANKGYFGYLYVSPANTVIFHTLIDSGEMHAGPNAENVASKLVLLPRGFISLAFNPVTAGAYTVVAELTPGLAAA